jgi:hypothetical protein
MLVSFNAINEDLNGEEKESEGEEIENEEEEEAENEEEDTNVTGFDETANTVDTDLVTG